MTDLTQRARDVAGRLLRRQIQQDSYGNLTGWSEPSRDADEAAAIISELVERIEGLEGTVDELYHESQFPIPPSVLGKQEGEG